MDLRVDIISIGTLSRNVFWDETQPVRTAHATTTLIRSGGQSLLVDPSLPAPALAARLFERTGLQPDDIDAVFLTNFRPAHRGGLELFEQQPVYIHRDEKQFVGERLTQLLQKAREEELEEADVIRNELEALKRTKSAPDKPLAAVDLFPLPGFTPGTCGLLVAYPTTTLLLAGDAVLTYDHFINGQVARDCHDVKQAQASLEETLEIADQLIPGHDNIITTPRNAGF